MERKVFIPWNTTVRERKIVDIFGERFPRLTDEEIMEFVFDASGNLKKYLSKMDLDKIKYMIE